MTEQKKQNISAYSQLSTILNELKTEKISINDAMNKIQLKESSPTRPYCKVTSSGSLALYGITKLPIVLYPEQWYKLIKVTKSSYLENYIKYNESRLKFKPKTYKGGIKQTSNESESKNNDEDVIPQESIEIV
jgi:hypothetical protein